MSIGRGLRPARETRDLGAFGKIGAAAGARSKVTRGIDDRQRPLSGPRAELKRDIRTEGLAHINKKPDDFEFKGGSDDAASGKYHRNW